MDKLISATVTLQSENQRLKTQMNTPAMMHVPQVLPDVVSNPSKLQVENRLKEAENELKTAKSDLKEANLLAKTRLNEANVLIYRE